MGFKSQMAGRLSQTDRDKLEYDFKVSDLDLKGIDKEMRANEYKEEESLIKVDFDVESELRRME